METSVILHPDFQAGKVDQRIFGGFLEHLGRAVYGGIYDPESVHAGTDGCRKDVLDALDRLDITAMRYPGGNFVSGYHWQDGIGPLERRPVKNDPVWKSLESNRFGTDEFLRLCVKMKWKPMMTVNLGTGSPVEALNWLLYTNSHAGTNRYSGMRAENGFFGPYNVKLWCLGNEMDGPWQLGHVPVEQYAALAEKTAKMMKEADPSIELTACGTSAFGMPSYLDWDRHVLESLSGDIDYLSIHRYVGNRENDTMEYLAVTGYIDSTIEEIDALCRFVKARRKDEKRVFISFDEWNVWYKNMEQDGHGMQAPHLLEEVYNLEDALVVAGFLNSFIRHADCVKIANIAQAVNVIAPILTRGDEMLLQSIYYAFGMFTGRREGISLKPVVKGPSYLTKSKTDAFYADVSAILSQDILHTFIVNRSLNEKMIVNLEMAGIDLFLENAELLTGKDPKDSNSFEDPYKIKPISFSEAAFKNGKAVFELPPLSFLAASWKL
ncbi:MAG: alpha-L-arabinofuranosidase C-terminal domain-containing protein [Brevinematales bacterium]|jgi:alpha-N-arabinofuranosidase